MKEEIRFEVLKKIADTMFRVKDFKSVSNLDSTSPPSVFIGSKLKYPLMNVGILSPLEREKEAWVFDDPQYWAKENFEIKDVIGLREGLLNSRFQTNATVARVGSKFVDLAQEIAIAAKPVDLEIKLKSTIVGGRKNDRVLTPHGLKAPLKEAKITSNVKVHRKIDKVINDEIKASEGIELLYKNDFSENVLSKILSVGVMGLKKNKRLVPTRWSITATDDTIGKHLLKEVKGMKWLEDFELFYGEFLGNCYLILMFPGVFSYELFELYLPGSSWNPSQEIKASTDYESYAGRKTYAFSTAGGYYASRLPIVEYLHSIKRQASVLAIRIELPTYWASLGVWVVRESVRKALAKKMKFGVREEILESARKISRIKYNFDVEGIIRRSKLLREKKEQKDLGQWF